MKYLSSSFICVLFMLCIFPQENVSSSQGETVGWWAETFGKELWDLAQTITQSTEIKSKYRMYNVQVEKKDPRNLLSNIVNKVNSMLRRKMDAIKCILMTAEDAAEEYVYNDTDSDFEYYSSKYSAVRNEETGNWETPELPDSLKEDNDTYETMVLNPDTHFYNIPVNTSHSSVHVPTNVFDKSMTARAAIEWSEKLDDIFVQNYNSDPALSWQYFGTSSGVMRHYPAMQWQQEVDLFDCRTRSWFIEAATCSKDVVILLDNSGSMTGMGNHIARFTVSKILDTFSNNDFINIFQYHNDVEPLEPCFNNTLVQATLENINIFKNRMSELRPENNANLAVAITKAFEILKQFREKRGCDEESMGCNQGIMVVTDGVPNNATELFEKFNWLNNGTSIPVRVFTYLIGREDSNVPEIMWMACLNRGYFVHVQSLDETTEEVLKYIPVFARPLVLQGVEHPVSWTHAYITDNSFTEKVEGFEDYRLLTSVAVPAFDRKVNQDNKAADLLGVAGTDVPIEDFQKLSLPYKIGVNGYAFVVSNNGYLIMHPNLRPLYEGKLNRNYNSMDLTEVEFLDDDLGPREFNEKILELREAMVNASEGSITGLYVKNFYDDMKRAYKELYDYYYAPLMGTPFTIGIALPQSHGDKWLKVGDEIKYHKDEHFNISTYFTGENWKIHPQWVYCKYHYLEGHEFKTSEEELIHFLHKINSPDWTWSEQYEDVKESDNDMFMEEEEVQCGRKTLADDDYFCDEDLVQRLIFDAKITYIFFENPWKYKREIEETLLKYYNPVLRFVGTMSGLTRWEYIKDNSSDITFGDEHSKAIDETWYKSAILQHKIDQNSFVYSVDFNVSSSDQDILVTASYALYPRDAGLESPGCVVGFQIQHANMFQRFMNITSKTNCEDCGQPCSDDLLDCYVIDSSGYILISEDQSHVGKFFGEIEGAIMESMVINNTFEKVTVYDLQAVCTRELTSSDSNMLFSPLNYISYVIHWIVHKFVLLAVDTIFYTPWKNIVSAYDYVDITTEKLSIPKPTKKLLKGQNREEEEYFKQKAEQEPERIFITEPCDKEATLYILNQTKLMVGDGFSGEIRSECSRPYFIQRIPNSNLILVVVNTTTQTCYRSFTTGKEDINYTEPKLPPCNKLALNDLPRRKLSGCFNEHPLEYQISTCRASSFLQFNILLLLLLQYLTINMYYI